MVNDNYHLLVIDDVASIHEDFRKILLPTHETPYQCLDEINEKLLGKSSPKANSLPKFQIDFALQGQEGINLVQHAKISNNPYAVAFVDVQMPPGLDGVETIKNIWMIDPEVQVVICTAYAKYTWEDLMNRFGETDRLYILKKPFENIEIMQLACSLSKKWNLNRVLQKEFAKLKNLSIPAVQKKEVDQSVNSMKDAIQSLASINYRFQK